MCWCLRVYGTVLHNLLIRFYNYLVDLFYTNDCHLYCGCCCLCCIWLRRQLRYCCSCCCCYNQRDTTITSNPNENGTDSNDRKELQYQHDYVIVDEADANYIELEQRKIETEPYYRTIDRQTAEQLLAERDNGTCLVRPFKEIDISIKYIVSIYSQQQYFHLFIRQIDGRDRYGIGQIKPNERHFSSPSEIIDFYSTYPLQCTNKQTTQCLILKPIVA